jgi:peptide-methionine (R)-S-oxide reductase
MKCQRPGLLFFITSGILLMIGTGCQKQPPESLTISDEAKIVNESSVTDSSKSTIRVERTDEEWQQKLTPEQYRVLRQKGTEQPFTDEMKGLGAGAFVCAGCGNSLFVSETKYDSGCGWPSFYDVVVEDQVKEKVDLSFGMVRTEVLCARCDGHLGHVFSDGPKPTGLRYCINSVSIQFVENSQSGVQTPSLKKNRQDSLDSAKGGSK